MRNRWDETEASAFFDALGECAYGSRLIGAEPDLVLHGGGNTSVKASFLDVTGREIEALYVKGSGWDLASIEPAGFSPLRLERLAELLELEALTDAQMMSELSAARLDPGAPQPSVESLLHAFIPFPAVQHSHADVIVTLTNVSDGESLVKEVFGDESFPMSCPGLTLPARCGGSGRNTTVPPGRGWCFSITASSLTAPPPARHMTVTSI
jgi:rhamnose utilization protein RhaD (predicted bifunctional aldolase and dehydrogenase)